MAVTLDCENSGESVRLLNSPISKSGEGTIYKTSQHGFVAKIYHEPEAEKIQKLQVMIRNRPEDPTAAQGHVSIAWPEDILRDNLGKPLGFLMPEIQDSKTLLEVYNPKLRRIKKLSFNWQYLHATAENVAYIVDVLHGRGYVIGDIKDQNILVTSTASVSIIDADSFQVRDSARGKVIAVLWVRRSIRHLSCLVVILVKWIARRSMIGLGWRLLFGSFCFHIIPFLAYGQEVVMSLTRLTS